MDSILSYWPDGDPETYWDAEITDFMINDNMYEFKINFRMNSFSKDIEQFKKSMKFTEFNAIFLIDSATVSSSPYPVFDITYVSIPDAKSFAKYLFEKIAEHIPYSSIVSEESISTMSFSDFQDKAHEGEITDTDSYNDFILRVYGDLTEEEREELAPEINEAYGDYIQKVYDSGNWHVGSLNKIDLFRIAVRIASDMSSYVFPNPIHKIMKCIKDNKLSVKKHKIDTNLPGDSSSIYIYIMNVDYNKSNLYNNNINIDFQTQNRTFNFSPHNFSLIFYDPDMSIILDANQESFSYNDLYTEALPKFTPDLLYKIAFNTYRHSRLPYYGPATPVDFVDLKSYKILDADKFRNYTNQYSKELADDIDQNTNNLFPKFLINKLATDIEVHIRFALTRVAIKSGKDPKLYAFIYDINTEEIVINSIRRILAGDDGQSAVTEYFVNKILESLSRIDHYVDLVCDELKSLSNVISFNDNLSAAFKRRSNKEKVSYVYKRNICEKSNKKIEECKSI